MPAARFLTRVDRAARHERIVAAYLKGATSRAVAASFGLTDSHVRAIVRLYGVARPRGKRVEMADVHVGLPSTDAITGLPTFTERSA